MCKGKGLWLCTIAMLMLTTIGIAQDKDRNPDDRNSLVEIGCNELFKTGWMMFVRQDN